MLIDHVKQEDIDKVSPHPLQALARELFHVFRKALGLFFVSSLNFLDIVLDFGVYGVIPVGFAFADPAANAIPAAVLVFSFYVNGASFLAFAVMAEKHGMTTDQRGEKSLFFTTGLAEATETIAVFVIACLFPAWFPLIAWLFAAICIYTALSRIVMTAKVLHGKK